MICEINYRVFLYCAISDSCLSRLSSSTAPILSYRIRSNYDEFDELQHAYAVTIHKAQGSEYPCVVIPVHMQHYMMLHRAILYTGVTRGRKLVVLVGAVKALAMAVKRVDSRRRITTLRERLQRASPATERLRPPSETWGNRAAAEPPPIYGGK